MNIEELEQEDTIRIYQESLKDVEFEVSDVALEDIGVATVVVVSLLSGRDRYMLDGVVDSETIELKCLENEETWEVNKENIEHE